MKLFTKKRLLSAVAGVSLLAGSLALAQKPAKNVSSAKHSNLAAAQRLSRQAFDKIIEAQRANEWDLGGHAQKAKDLLDQVNNELKLAAETSNRNK